MPKHRSLAVVALVLAAGGCRESTASGSSLAVTLRIDPPQTTLIGDVPGGGPEISCTFGLTAVATGRGTADWQGGRTFWYFGADRSVAVDTTGNDPGDLFDAFGGARTIAGGETLHGQWTLTASAPARAKTPRTIALSMDTIIGE
jgi:hypothetical protein